MNFEKLTNTLTSSIFSWDYFSDFKKISDNTYKVKKRLSLLTALLWEDNIENKFLEIIRESPKTREVLPLLIAVRNFDKEILDRETLEIKDIKHLFTEKADFEDQDMINFFVKSGLKEIFESKKINNLVDYVFGVETGLDSNARKNRTWDLMEDIVEEFVKDLCEKNPWFEYKEQATSSFMKTTWNIDVQSDKSSRRFDFSIYNRDKHEVYLIEVNYYGGGWSKLKAVAGEFAGLYDFMQNQNIKFFWITDWLGWNTALKPLEEAYNKMEGNIYNIEMLKEGVLDELVK